MSFIAYITLALYGLVCFLAGTVYEINKQVREIRQFIKDDNDGKKTSEKENEEIHEYGEIPKSCPGGWKNCPGTDSDGKVFPDSYADAASGA